MRPLPRVESQGAKAEMEGDLAISKGQPGGVKQNCAKTAQGCLG